MLQPYWRIPKLLKYPTTFDIAGRFEPTFAPTDVVVNFELRMVKEVKVAKGDLRAFYECTECGRCGCPSFKVEALTTPPDYIVEHLVNHVRFYHES